MSLDKSSLSGESKFVGLDRDRGAGEVGIRVEEFPEKASFLDQQLLSLSTFFSLQSILTISFRVLFFGSVSLQTVSSCVLSLVLVFLRLSLQTT